jgi:hypothetical protein
MIGGYTSLRSGGGGTATRTPAMRSTSRSTGSTREATQQSSSSNKGAAADRAVTAGKSKVIAPLRGQWVVQAMSPKFHGRRAAAWMTIWDKGSVARRTSILEALKQLHADSNLNALNDDLGDAAPLLFSRLTSWWKMRYAIWASEATRASPPPAVTSSVAAGSPSSSELLAQVEAITVFVRGSRYLLQFVEGGGAAALCDCLETTSAAAAAVLPSVCPQASSSAEGRASKREGYAQERCAITLLLLHIANSGRVYREMVGEVDNLLHILKALLRETDAAVATQITELLAVLGKGHPRLSATVQTGMMRVLASAFPSSDDATDRAGATAAATVHQLSVFKPLSSALPQPRPSPGQGTALPSEVVVLGATRAIRALQLQAEQQHFAQFSAATLSSNNNNKVGGGGSGETSILNRSARMIDYVPIIGLDSTVTASTAAAAAAAVGTGVGLAFTHTQEALLRPFTTAEYLNTLFHLALDEAHTAYRVEGNELLNLAAKNILLTPKILTRCLDVVDDDIYTIEGIEGGDGGVGDGEEGDHAGVTQSRLRCQRRQLSCGRAAVLILISRPMTAERRDLLLQLVGQRGGHLTLLKYLRLTQHGDTAAVVDCCHALQFIAQASMELQQRQLGQQQHSSPSGGAAGLTKGQSRTSDVVLTRMTEGIQSALGDAVFHLLLFQELSEEDCMAVLRSARAAAMGQVN